MDAEASREFMGQALQTLREEDLAGIGSEAERKRAAFASLLAPDRVRQGYGRDDLRRLLRSVFSTRRQADAILGGEEAVARLNAALTSLFEDGRPLAERFDGFCAAAPIAEAYRRIDLASECLHFSDPERYWLWTRWVWDPDVRTGALALVTVEGFATPDGTPGATYVSVGDAIARVARAVEAEGLTLRARGPFAIDVFLVAVYAVYLYTVLRMRMTNEFTKVVPGLADLTRRLLGVRGLEV